MQQTIEWHKKRHEEYRKTAVRLLSERDMQILDLEIEKTDIEKRLRDMQLRCFAARKLTREEYQEVWHYVRCQSNNDRSRRLGCWYQYEFGSELSTHFFNARHDAGKIRAGIVEYVAASEEYMDYLIELEIGRAADLEEARIERHAQYYLNAVANGYDAYTASEAAMDAIRHER